VSWIYCEDEEVAANSAVEELLDSPKPPSIIFTSNNDMLLAVLKVAGNRGLAIGKDLSVISFDDSPWAAAMVPGITVIARPLRIWVILLLLNWLLPLKVNQSQER